MTLIKKIQPLKKISAILFFATFTFPAFASLPKAETLLTQGQFDEALAVLSPLVTKNDPHALYLTAVIYLSPKSSYLNFPKGIELLEKAIALNYAPALDELAGLYLSGEGVEKNESTALYYYKKASDMGYGPSQFNCGILYKEGQGTKQNPVMAYFYLCLASLNHHDLEDVTINAAQYRDEVAPFLTPQQRQDVLRQVNALTLPKEYGKIKKSVRP